MVFLMWKKNNTCFPQKFYYINAIGVVRFFYFILIFNGAVSFGRRVNLTSPIQSELPFYFGEKEMIIKHRKCKCGCGQTVKNRFVSGHNNRGYIPWNKGKSPSLETLLKRSKSLKGKKHNISEDGLRGMRENCYRTSQLNRGKPSKLRGKRFSEEQKKNVSNDIKRAYFGR